MRVLTLVAWMLAAVTEEVGGGRGLARGPAAGVEEDGADLRIDSARLDSVHGEGEGDEAETVACFTWLGEASNRGVELGLVVEKKERRGE